MSRLLVVIPGDPGDGSINAAYSPGTRQRKGGGKPHATLIKTPRGNAFALRVVLAGKAAKARDPEAAAVVREALTLGVTVRAYWPRRRNLPGTTDLGGGDWDSPIKLTIDPLQDWYGKGKRKNPGAGLFDDDVRIIGGPVWKFYDKENPRIEVEIYPLEITDGPEG